MMQASHNLGKHSAELGDWQDFYCCNRSGRRLTQYVKNAHLSVSYVSMHGLSERRTCQGNHSKAPLLPVFRAERRRRGRWLWL